MKYILAIICCALFTGSSAQPAMGDATLQINPGGHLAQISEAVMTSDRRYIITASTDKTICIWDAVDKKLVDQIRGPKSIFNQGKLFSIAISPDNKYIAVGGFLAIGTEGNGVLAGQIRIYDFASRKQLFRLKGHTNVVTALRFTGDGKYLISGGIDSTLIAWKVGGTTDKPSFSRDKQIIKPDFFSEDIETSGNSAFVTEENRIVKYTVPSFIRKVTSKNYKGSMASITINREKNIVVATTKQDELIVLDTGLVEIQYIKLNSYSTETAISPDGNTIITEGENGQVLMFVKKNGKYSLVKNSQFAGGTTILGMNFINEREFFVSGGKLHLLQFYEIKNNGNTTSSIVPGAALSGAGRTFTGISVLDKNLALSDSLSFDFMSTGFSYLFNMEAGRLQNFNPSDSSLYPRSVTQKGSLRLSTIKYSSILDIKSGDSVIGTITRDGANGYSHVCVAITKNNYVISGGAAGFLNLYDTLGRIIASFIGHEGDVESIKETEDGDFLYSTSLDQTIRMWDMRKIKNSLSFKSFSELDPAWKQFIVENYLSFDTAKTAMEKLYNQMKEEGNTDNANYLIKPQVIEPRLNMFIAKNNEWVMWNNKGYFKASSNGASYIGWYVYKGEDNNAEFFSADKLYATYYRPDIINELAFTNKTTAEILDNIKEGTRLSIAQQVNNMPVIKLGKPSAAATIAEKNINLVFEVENKEYLGDLILYQNGKRVAVSPDKIRGLTLNNIAIPVELITGENVFAASVLNKNGVESSPLRFQLMYAGAKPTSSLYIFAVGVDKYKNTKYNLNYARADASGIAMQLRLSANTIFKDIHIDSLYDEDATVENISKKLELLQSVIKPEDVFLFYYAGHGVMNDPTDGSKPDFYLVLHKVTQMTGNETMLKQNALSASILKDILLKIPAQKQLILLDACNSGGAINTLTRGAGEEAAIFQLARSTGFTVLSSTNQEQNASEVATLGHGIFTYAILNGLNGEADLKKDGKITVKEIEVYLNDIIPILSEKYKGSQQYPQSFSRGMDFPLTIKKE